MEPGPLLKDLLVQPFTDGTGKTPPKRSVCGDLRTGMCLHATKDIINSHLSKKHMYYMTTFIHPGIFLREMQLMSIPNSVSEINPTLRIFSFCKFQIYKLVLLTVVTMLDIISSKCIYHITRSLFI